MHYTRSLQACSERQECAGQRFGFSLAICSYRSDKHRRLSISHQPHCVWSVDAMLGRDIGLAAA
jgi:hypothetical protein